MRLSLFRFAFDLAGVCLLAAPCAAQYTLLPPRGVPIRATATFTVPQNADPAAVNFTMEGELYTQADGATPGDNSGPEITGQLLATNGSAPGDGLELHGLLPPTGGPTSPRPDVLDVDIFTTYTGGLRVDSITPMPFSLAYNPWTVMQITPIAGYVQGFRFTSDGITQPPINFNKFFACSAFRWRTLLIRPTYIVPSSRCAPIPRRRVCRNRVRLRSWLAPGWAAVCCGVLAAKNLFADASVSTQNSLVGEPLRCSPTKLFEYDNREVRA